MGLVIQDRPEFEATVVVRTAHLRGEFKARFVALPSSKLDELQAAAVRAGKGPEGLLYDVCTWFETVQTPRGEIVHDGPDSLARLMDWPGIGPAMAKTYWRTLWEEASGN